MNIDGEEILTPYESSWSYEPDWRHQLASRVPSQRGMPFADKWLRLQRDYLDMFTAQANAADFGLTLVDDEEADHGHRAYQHRVPGNLKNPPSHRHRSRHGLKWTGFEWTHLRELASIHSRN